VHSILFLLMLKISFSYLNVELDYWLSHLTPNAEKYNFLNLPVNFSEYLEFLIIPLMLFYLILNIGKMGGLIVPFLITIGLYFLNIGTAIITSNGILDSVNYSVKICAPIYFFMVLVIHSKNTGQNITKILIGFIVYCILLSIIALMFFNESFNRGSVRLPVFFSGLHTHNYVLSVVFVGVTYLLRKKPWLAIAFMFASFLFLIAGYNVRTVVVFYFVFICFMLYYLSDFFKYMYYKIFLFIPFILGLIWMYFKDLDFDRFSSGRLTMYAKKFDILDTYTLKDYLFGRGWGADMVRTTEWWWEEKGSHNDYLTYVVENGIPFTLLYITLLLSLLFISRKVSILLIALILGYLLTSALSNGFAVRPLAGYLFFMVFAFIYINNKSYTLKNE